MYAVLRVLRVECGLCGRGLRDRLICVCSVDLNNEEGVDRERKSRSIFFIFSQVRSSAAPESTNEFVARLLLKVITIVFYAPKIMNPSVCTCGFHVLHRDVLRAKSAGRRRRCDLGQK